MIRQTEAAGAGAEPQHVAVQIIPDTGIDWIFTLHDLFAVLSAVCLVIFVWTVISIWRELR